MKKNNVGKNVTRKAGLNHCDICESWMTPKIGQGTVCAKCKPIVATERKEMSHLTSCKICFQPLQGTQKQKEAHETKCLSEQATVNEAVMSAQAYMNEVKHSPTPWKASGKYVVPQTDGVSIAQATTLKGRNEQEEIANEELANANAAYIVRAVNSYEDLLEAAKNARNVLAALVTGDLKEVKADSIALQLLRNAIAKAEGK